MQPLEIKSRFGNYSVHFLDNLQSCLKQAMAAGPHQFLVDEKVYELYRKDFDAIGAEPSCWPATEQAKTYAALEGAFELLLSKGFKKNTRLIVVGGGILQDAGGFVASTLFRGIEWDLIPTTLLAQVDSCIGAKTSVNLPRAKNLLGTFYPPRRVLLTPYVLPTLAPGDIKSGLSEAIKLAMIDGPESVAWMKDRLPGALKVKGLEEFLHRTLRIKQRFIEEDEMDKSVRNLLNYGHTFGHAIEQITNYAIPHGVAVGMGMEMAAFFSYSCDLMSKDEWVDVATIMSPLTRDSWTTLGAVSKKSFVEVMKADKKNTGSEITFILSRGYGRMTKFPLTADRAEILLGEYFAARAEK